MKILLLAPLLLASALARAQQDEPIHTLRVFTNLIQIPTLVLDDRGAPVEEKAKPKFLVTIDGGKPFPATHARLEGDDPISLAVLMDARGSQQELINDMSSALPGIAGGNGLRPQDHVSIYAMDCDLVKSLSDEPADKTALRGGVQTALKSAELHYGKNHTPCPGRASLRAQLLTIAQALGQLPGRRVIIAVTDGLDPSASGWPEVNSVLQHTSTTLFGIALSARSQTSSSVRGQPPIALKSSAPYDAGFEALAQTSGGIVLTANDMTLRERLALVIKLLRGRYIVEFPRSDEMKSGQHLLAVEVVGKKYFVRSTGASLPIADPKLKDDPTVLRVPKDPAGPGL